MSKKIRSKRYIEIWSVKVKVISKHSGEKGMTENDFVQKNSRLTSFRVVFGLSTLNSKKLVLKSGFFQT